MDNSEQLLLLLYILCVYNWLNPLKQSYELSTISISILQMKKRRHRGQVTFPVSKW